MSPMLGSLQCLRHKYRRYDSDPFLRVGFCSGHMLYWRSQSFYLEVKKKSELIIFASNLSLPAAVRALKSVSAFEVTMTSRKDGTWCLVAYDAIFIGHRQGATSVIGRWRTEAAGRGHPKRQDLGMRVGHELRLVARRI